MISSQLKTRILRTNQPLWWGFAKTTFGWCTHTKSALSSETTTGLAGHAKSSALLGTEPAAWFSGNHRAGFACCQSTLRLTTNWDTNLHAALGFFIFLKHCQHGSKIMLEYHNAGRGVLWSIQICYPKICCDATWYQLRLSSLENFEFPNQNTSLLVPRENLKLLTPNPGWISKNIIYVKIKNMCAKQKQSL